MGVEGHKLQVGRHSGDVELKYWGDGCLIHFLSALDFFYGHFFFNFLYIHL